MNPREAEHCITHAYQDVSIASIAFSNRFESSGMSRNKSRQSWLNIYLEHSYRFPLLACFGQRHSKDSSRDLIFTYPLHALVTPEPRTSLDHHHR